MSKFILIAIISIKREQEEREGEKEGRRQKKERKKEKRHRKMFSEHVSRKIGKLNNYATLYADRQLSESYDAVTIL